MTQPSVHSKLTLLSDFPDVGVPLLRCPFMPLLRGLFTGVNTSQICEFDSIILAEGIIKILYRI